MSQLPCDIMIGAHPFVSDLDGKLKRRAEHPGAPNPFIDAGACRALAAGGLKGLDERVAEETRKKKGAGH
jgi:metallo-beta-lactamase class B